MKKQGNKPPLSEAKLRKQVRALQRDVAALRGGNARTAPAAPAAAASSSALSAADRARLDVAFSTGRAQPTVTRTGSSMSFSTVAPPLEPRPTTRRAAAAATATGSTSTPRSAAPSDGLSASERARLDAALGTAGGTAAASVRRTPTSLTFNVGD